VVTPHSTTTEHPGTAEAADQISPFDFYGGKVAAADLRHYREHGPRPWTQALLAALSAEGINGATLLDIGGGVGVIQHELLDAGAASATSVEASTAYLGAARDEAGRRGHAGRVTFKLGDFVELAASVPPADIVTLDRVLNVYPGWERLATLAAGHAQRLLGIVVPRETPLVRLVVTLMNVVMRLRRQSIRAAVVSADAIDNLARKSGLEAAYSNPVGPWQVMIYQRVEGRPNGTNRARPPEA
jgi:magnesium-protoporphyrin O-methyltransferase